MDAIGRVLGAVGAMVATLVLCGGCTAVREPLTSGVVPGVVLYVSTSGNDAWSGRSPKRHGSGNGGPFATLTRARDEIRRIKAEGGLPEGGVAVELLGGRYEMAAPLALTAEDSGTATSPILYRGRPGAAVRLSGGRIVTGWVPVTDPAVLRRLAPAARGHVIQADLKALGITEYGDMGVDAGAHLQALLARADGQGEYTMGSVPPKPGAVRPERLEVFCNDEPMSLSQGPNDGPITITRVLGETIRDVRGHKSCVEGIFQYEGDYPKRWVGEKDAWVCGSWSRDWAEQRHRIESLDPEKRVIAVRPPYHYYGYHAGQWFYGFNLLVELDQPGEWTLDREAGILYFWPPRHRERGKVEVSMASALVTMNGTSYVALRGLTLEAARGSAVTMDDCSQCRVIGCTVRDLGLHGVAVVGGTADGVVGCDLYGMGGGGIYLIGGDRQTLTPAGHYAENNHIHHYARWDHMYRPAIVFSGVGQRASHNLIHDAPHSAIIFGGNDHLIEFNEIHSVCTDSNDCGAIYAGRDWTLRGHVIRNNYLHHLCGRLGRVTRGIYLDDSFAAALIEGNIFAQVTYAVFLGGGRDTVVQNNIFVDCPSAMHLDARGLGWQSPHLDGRIKEATEKGTLRGIRFREPPYSTRYPELLTLLADEPKYPKGNVVRRNIFWQGSGEDLRRMGAGAEPAATWWDHIEPKVRDLVTVENNLINEDPHFVDERAGDFRLRPDSPAWGLGFQRIPTEQIGLYKDPGRASWPVRHSPRAMPALTVSAAAAPPARRTLRTGPPPVFRVGPTVSPVTIDGDLTSAEWAGRKRDAALVVERSLTHDLVTRRSYAWMAHDDRHLYVAILNETDPSKPLTTGVRWGANDAVELALRNPAAGETAPILALRGYPDGRFESSSEAGAPDAVAQAAGTAVTFAARVIDDGHWAAEYRVPLDLLNLAPAPGARLECNLSVRQSAAADWVMWQGTGGKTWETGKAGLLELSP